MTSTWTPADIPDQTGRTFVITGANSGIGLGATKALGAKGARVVLAVRNSVKGEAAARAIDGEAEVRALDLADLGSVREFAAAIDALDVLINNAGVMNVPLARTADGFEMQIGTNHLGHFALTNLLLPRISDRVVTVASGAHRYGKIRLDDLNSERGYHRHRAYGQAKLANLLFIAELQRRLDEAGSSIRSVGAHPGWAATNLQTRSGNRVEDALMTVGNRLFAQSGDMGAQPTLYAATQDVPGNSYAGPDGWFRCAVTRRWSAAARRRKTRSWPGGSGRCPKTSPASPSRSRSPRRFDGRGRGTRDGRAPARVRTRVIALERR